MAQAQSAEEKAQLKKQWTDLAIKQAGTSQWEEAVLTNKNILQLFPSEPEAYNRLGKAYSELGQYAEARSAYSQMAVTLNGASSARFDGRPSVAENAEGPSGRLIVRN